MSPDPPRIHPVIRLSWRMSSRQQLTVRRRDHASTLHLISYSNRIVVLHGWLLDISELFVFESYLRTLPQGE
jgi:hypothetical protein